MSRQDIENAAPVRIALAESMAHTLGFKQIIVFGHSEESGTVITTWGDTVEHSAQAAAGANTVKKLWGWPAVDVVESGKVLALRERIAELEAQLSTPPPPAVAVKPTVHVIEGTEYERGWGQRPDGYVAFMSKEKAEAWIKEYNAKYNNEKSAPDEYTTYRYIGIRECSMSVYQEVKAREFKHIHRSGDLMT